MPDRNTHGLSHPGLAGHHHCHHHDVDGQVVSRGGGGEGVQLLVDGCDQPQGVEVMIRYNLHNDMIMMRCDDDDGNMLMDKVGFA